MALPLGVRVQIAERFGIEKKGPTEVFSNTIKSDGYFIKDVEDALSAEVLRDYLEIPEGMSTDIMFDLMVDKIQGRVTALPEIEVSLAPIFEAAPVSEEPKLTQYQKKKLKQNGHV